MPIPTDSKGRDALARAVGKRLKAARRAAGVSQAQAAARLNQKGITQISLAEDGKRMPTLLDMVKYADLYAVPIDFLLARIDDPIAEAQEQGQAMIVRSVAHSIGGMFGQFANAVAAHVSISLSHLRQDRADLQDAIEAADEVERALTKVRELNPEFDELRNGAKLESTVKRLAGIGKRMATRVQDERVHLDMIDKALEIERVEGHIQQFQFEFNALPTEGGTLSRPAGRAGNRSQPQHELQATV